MNNGLLFNMEDYIKLALKEDISYEDVSTNSIIESGSAGKIELIAKEDGVLCGISVFERTFQLLDKKSYFKTKLKDGDKIKKSDLIGVLYADIDVILSAERVALNFLQRMCGIATQTNKLVELLEGSSIKLVDTRKTAPNLRLFDKYAVKIGGGINHRYNLSDCVMLKDNHIEAAGGIRKAVELAKKYKTFVSKIEVEVESMYMIKEAVDANVDVIMLDNMSYAQMEEAIEYINGRALVEISGNVDESKIKEVYNLKADFISSGSITHSVKAMDISMKNLSRI